MSARTGQCMCGAVRFTISTLNPDFGACHCRMCQRWAGSALLALTVPADTVRFEGRENIETYQSSTWAERAWCNKCGSGLWYRVTAEGPEEGIYHLPIGLLHDPSGLKMKRQIFVEEKSPAFAFANQTKNMTGQEVFDLYAARDEA